MEKDIQSNSSESAPSPVDRARAVGQNILDSLFGDKPRYSEADRIELAKRGAWVGETAWFSQDMASNPVSTLPHGFPVESLESAEIKAALKFKMISRIALTQVDWDRAQAAPDKAVPGAARSLLHKLEAHSTKN